MGLAISKVIAQLPCGSLTSTIYGPELKDSALTYGTNHMEPEEETDAQVY